MTVFIAVAGTRPALLRRVSRKVVELNPFTDFERHSIRRFSGAVGHDIDSKGRETLDYEIVADV